MAAIREEELERRQLELDDRVVGIVSSRRGDKYVCRVDNVKPGKVIARGEGLTRDEAEQAALALARKRVARSKQLHDTLTELHSSVASLDKRLSEPPPSSSKT
jgi:hypothetical protein